MREGPTTFVDDLPQLDPVIRHEETETGWRGLTDNGEIFEIKGRNGHRAAAPTSDILVMRKGKAVGRRAVSNDCPLSIDEYLDCFNRACDLFRANDFTAALHEIELLIDLVPALWAKANRSQMLLAAGRWEEGWALYEECERQQPFQRPRTQAALAAGLRPWRGEVIKGRSLLLLHDHGFGDTIQMLRYAARLQAMGASVKLLMPPELGRLAAQVAPVVSEIEPADYFCSMLMLGWTLGVTPENLAPNWPLVVDERLADKWAHRLGVADKPKIGIAWSVGQPVPLDYPREIPLKLLVDALASKAALYSVQKQGREEAQALGVAAYEIDDFADCAALMSQLDWIVSVDTAALHLAGAIEHPRVTGLLSHWRSWRWIGTNWYPTVSLCRQMTPGDWGSALGLACN